MKNAHLDTAVGAACPFDFRSRAVEVLGEGLAATP
jgi:hypothetical protein